MTDNKLGVSPDDYMMGHGLTDRQDRYCRLVASGVSFNEAARQAGYKSNVADGLPRHKKPNIAARIEFYRAQYKANSVAEEAKKTVIEKLRSGELPTLAEIMVEAYLLIGEAREQGKFKDANESLRLLAQLGGYVKGGARDPADESGSRELNPLPGLMQRSPNGTVTQSPINLQVVTQIGERLGGALGTLTALREESAEEPDGRTGKALSDARDVLTVDSLESASGDDGEAIPVTPASRSA